MSSAPASVSVTLDLQCPPFLRRRTLTLHARHSIPHTPAAAPVRHLWPYSVPSVSPPLSQRAALPRGARMATMIPARSSDCDSAHLVVRSEHSAALMGNVLVWCFIKLYNVNQTPKQVPRTGTFHLVAPWLQRRFSRNFSSSIRQATYHTPGDGHPGWLG
ncbi:hypothetical protein J6590_015754 [Homalodisca vitripennis]|nr:hypothetical protein J6590_015754 [Homalodisca vitripennis]